MRVFCGMLIAAAAVAVAPAAMAQAPAEGTSYVVTYIEVVPSAGHEAAGLLKEVAAASRKEAGNQRYDILQRIDRENQFVILEAWTDPKAAEVHAGASALKQFKDKLKPLQAGFYDERPSVGVAVAPAPAPASEGTIYVVTHVDVAPPRKDDLHRPAQQARRGRSQRTECPTNRGLAADQPDEPLYGYGDVEEPRCAGGPYRGRLYQGVPRTARADEWSALRRAAL